MTNHKLHRVVAALVMSATLILQGVSTALAAPPTNDNFADAVVIGALPYNDARDIGEATTEPGELQPCTYSPQTVWYAITPTANVVIRVDMAGSSFSDTSLVVYQAAGPGLGGLSFVSCAAWGGSLTVNALAGTTYYIQAGNIYGGGGNLQLNVQEVPPPANDNFANATPIAALPFTGTVDPSGASREAGEPTSSCGSPNGTVWYAFTAAAGESVSASVGFPWSSMIAAYTGNSLGGLTEMDCRSYGGVLTFRAEAGTTYYFQVGDWYGGSSLQFHLEVTPPPVAGFYFYPYDPSIFDTVQFNDSSYDPGQVGFQSWTWDFGDGTTGSDPYVSHRYAADGDFTVTLQVTTADGRSASTSQVVHVATHDVAIISLIAPQAASVGQTRQIYVDVSNKRYPEEVQVQLFKSAPGSYGNFVLVGTLTQYVPVRSANRTTRFTFSYTFTNDDANVRKVTFKAVASIVGARDALSADNEAIASPTKVAR